MKTIKYYEVCVESFLIFKPDNVDGVVMEKFERDFYAKPYHNFIANVDSMGTAKKLLELVFEQYENDIKEDKEEIEKLYAVNYDMTIIKKDDESIIFDVPSYDKEANGNFWKPYTRYNIKYIGRRLYLEESRDYAKIEKLIKGGSE